MKTARRDLEALAIAGIPVYSQPGKGGGWSLLGGARTDLSGLTADEARTLFLVAGPSSTATPEAKAALRKLVQALPETFRADAEAAAAAVVLDPAGWGGTARPRPTHLDALQRAVVDGVQVRLGYADRARSETERVVHPLGLVEKDSIWYLVADTANGMRTFRVNRVRGVDADRRAGGAAGRASTWPTTWESVVSTMEERRTSQRAVVVVTPPAHHGLRAQFGPRTTVLADARRRAGRGRDRRADGGDDRRAARRLGGDRSTSSSHPRSATELARDRARARRPIRCDGRRVMTDVTPTGSSILRRHSE